MYDLDHMLNGSGSRQHHQDMIRQAQRTKLASEIKPIQHIKKATLPLRAIFAALINMVTKTI